MKQRTPAYRGPAAAVNQAYAPVRCIARQPVAQARLAYKILTIQKTIARLAICREPGPARYRVVAREVTSHAEYSARQRRSIPAHCITLYTDNCTSEL